MTNAAAITLATGLPPRTDWQETIPPDEAARFERHAELLHGIQVARAQGRPDRRGLHAKPHAGFEVQFDVVGDLPAHARVGIFAAPGTYRGWVRFSNGSGSRQPDKAPDARGLALKLVGVPGRKLIPGLEDAVTQDFLLIRSPATPFRTADEFVALVDAARKPALLLPRLGARVGWGRLFSLLPQLIASLKNSTAPMLTAPYYSAAPIRWGDCAAHVRLEPVDPVPAPGPRDVRTPDFLAKEVAERVGQGPVTFAFRAQFYVDAARTPIEDGSVVWPDDLSPPLTVAHLTIPRQDVHSEHGQQVAAFVERLSFDPWHAPLEFRPLGNIMRARNAAYRRSTQERKAAAEPVSFEPG